MKSFAILLLTFYLYIYYTDGLVTNMQQSTLIKTQQTSSSFLTNRYLHLNSNSHHDLRSSTRLYAKKAKKNTSSSGNIKDAKGFKRKSDNVDIVINESILDDNIVMNTNNNALVEKSANNNIQSNELQTADDVYKKYGINTNDDNSSKKNKKKKQNNKLNAGVSTNSVEPAFGEEVLAKVPMKLQKQIDNILITGTFIALSFVVLCGIGISYGAFRIVFPNVVLDSNIDSIIINVLSPSFTPALGVFFFFSITLGLFKYAQISSDQTVYRE